MSRLCRTCSVFAAAAAFFACRTHAHTMHARILRNLSKLEHRLAAACEISIARIAGDFISAHCVSICVSCGAAGRFGQSKTTTTTTTTLEDFARDANAFVAALTSFYTPTDARARAKRGQPRAGKRVRGQRARAMDAQARAFPPTFSAGTKGEILMIARASVCVAQRALCVRDNKLTPTTSTSRAGSANRAQTDAGALRRRACICARARVRRSLGNCEPRARAKGCATVHTQIRGAHNDESATQCVALLCSHVRARPGNACTTTSWLSALRCARARTWWTSCW